MTTAAAATAERVVDHILDTAREDVEAASHDGGGVTNVEFWALLQRTTQSLGKGITIQGQHLPEDLNRRFCLFQALSVVHELAKQPHAAIPAYEERLAIARRLFRSTDARVMDTLRGLGLSYEKLRQHDRAWTQFSDLHAILRASTSQEIPDIDVRTVSVMTDMAYNMVERKEYPQAETWFRDVLRRVEFMGTSVPRDVLGKAQRNVGIVNELLRNKGAAAVMYARAAETFDDPRLKAECWNDQGRMQGDVRRAVAAHVKALDVAMSSRDVSMISASLRLVCVRDAREAVRGLRRYFSKTVVPSNDRHKLVTLMSLDALRVGAPREVIAMLNLGPWCVGDLPLGTDVLYAHVLDALEPTYLKRLVTDRMSLETVFGIVDRMQSTERMIDVLQRVGRATNDASAVLRKLAYCYEGAGRLAEALDTRRRLMRRAARGVSGFGEIVDAGRRLAETYERMGDATASDTILAALPSSSSSPQGP